MEFESNVDIIREYGLKHGIPEDQIEDYVRRMIIGMANF